MQKTNQNPEGGQIQVVLHKFNRIEREEIMQSISAVSQSIKIVNMPNPSKLVGNQTDSDLIVICPNNKQTDSIPSTVLSRNIVNKMWIQAMARNDGKAPAHTYGFSLEDQVFYLFDPDCQNDEETSVWKRNMIMLVERNQGRVVSRFTDFLAHDGGLMVVKGTENDKTSVVNSVTQIVKHFKLSAAQFRVLKIVKETFLTQSVEKGELQGSDAYDLGALFRILTQNDQSVFIEEMDTKPDTMGMSLEQKMEHFKLCQISEMAPLQECMIHIYDESLNPNAIRLCNLLGGMTTDSIVPFLTTHVVADKITPVLKQTISSLQSQAIEGNKAPGISDGRRGNAFSSFLSLHIVSIEWLKQCLMQETKVPEDQYKPEVSIVNGQSHSSQNIQSQRNKIIVRQNIFQGKVFAICHESYAESNLDINYMEKVVIENGGRVVDDVKKAKFILQEDGFDQEIWKQKGEEAENTGTVIHFRWVQECVKERAEMQTGDALHLCPLPHKVPIKAFGDYCVELSNASGALELLVFTHLVQLYGFKKRWQDGHTTHLVILNTENLERSKKLDQIKRFKQKPKCVNIDWLLDCLEYGRILDETDEKYAIKI